MTEKNGWGFYGRKSRTGKRKKHWLGCCAQKFDKIQGINTLKYTKKQLKKMVMRVGWFVRWA